MKKTSTKLKDMLNEHYILGELPSSKLKKIKWNPVTGKTMNEEGHEEDPEAPEHSELEESAFSLNEGFGTWKMQFVNMTLSGVTLDSKKVYTVKARSTVEAIKKASKAAGLSGNDWMATQTHKLTKIG
jgi:hypothetical protein